VNSRKINKGLKASGHLNKGTFLPSQKPESTHDLKVDDAVCFFLIHPQKWQKCNLVLGDRLCGQQHGLAMNWVDRPRTSADERDVVWAPRFRDCVWAVAGFGRFFIDLSFLREQSP